MEHFKLTIICKTCGRKAEIRRADNAGRGDDYVDWLEAICKRCGSHEEIEES